MYNIFDQNLELTPLAEQMQFYHHIRLMYVIVLV